MADREKGARSPRDAVEQDSDVHGVPGARVYVTTDQPDAVVHVVTGIESATEFGRVVCGRRYTKDSVWKRDPRNLLIAKPTSRAPTCVFCVVGTCW